MVRKDATGSTQRIYWNGNGRTAVSSTSPAVTEAEAQRSAASRGRLLPAHNDGELVVWAGEDSPRLAWDVFTEGMLADQTPSRLHTIVDANGSAVITAYDEVMNGTGNSQYSGTVTLNTISSGSSWLLKDSVGNDTTDLNGSTSGTGTQFTDTDTTWGTGSPSNRQTAGVDAQYGGAEKTFAYYKKVQGRNGIWNNGTGARSRVHYGNAYVNAFWDGSQMTYGDGSGNSGP